MSKKKSKSHENQIVTKIILVTAILELIRVVIEIITKLIE